MALAVGVSSSSASSVSAPKSKPNTGHGVLSSSMPASRPKDGVAALAVRGHRRPADQATLKASMAEDSPAMTKSYGYHDIEKVRDLMQHLQSRSVSSSCSASPGRSARTGARSTGKAPARRCSVTFVAALLLLKVPQIKTGFGADQSRGRRHRRGDAGRHLRSCSAMSAAGPAVRADDAGRRIRAGVRRRCRSCW